MIFRIEIREKRNFFDAQGNAVLKDIHDLEINSVEKVDFIQVYNFKGDLTPQEIRLIAEEILIDSVSQEYCLGSFNNYPSPNQVSLEIAYNPGVMDPVEDSVKKAIKDLGINKEVQVKTAKKYILTGNITKEELEIILDKLLYNKLIQHVV
ncbi:MAG: phosphoribosylformylglycinamidine synthase subunit PurS, partial [Candidatus Omnitrophica bacterium]|nr:phosphoribosylformylglycinamidine synthase subunit PurS [Candidatus Omnitrophota bacterium]